MTWMPLELPDADVAMDATWLPPGERREIREGAGRRGPPRGDGNGPRSPGGPGQPVRRGGRPPKGKPRMS